ncbi:MAG: hypothetical protein H6727_07175 [Myxococcales bacterium]|nr:hypothetical protein [Myxococcales bacterium]
MMKTYQIKTTSTWLFLFVSLLLGQTLSGCTTARMAVPPQLQDQGVSLPVERSVLRGAFAKEDMIFGPYQVHQVQRGWTNQGGFQTAFGGKQDASQRYSFQLQKGARSAWLGRCKTVAQSTNVRPLIPIRISDRREALRCALEQKKDGQNWTLMVRSDNERAIQGWLLANGARIRVQGSHSIAGSDFPMSTPAGYLFRLDGQVIAAVDVLGKGVVWFSKGTPPPFKHVIATASAALLLHQALLER